MLILCVALSKSFKGFARQTTYLGMEIKIVVLQFFAGLHSGVEVRRNGPLLQMLSPWITHVSIYCNNQLSISKLFLISHSCFAVCTFLGDSWRRWECSRVITALSLLLGLKGTCSCPWQVMELRCFQIYPSFTIIIKKQTNYKCI